MVIVYVLVFLGFLVMGWALARSDRRQGSLEHRVMLLERSRKNRKR